MDKYGHVNNMIYYSYFDTVVTDYIVRIGQLDTDQSLAVGLVVESHCTYHRPISFPAIVECGLRVGKLGTSSVRYEIGVFASGETDIVANGYFVHVFVNRNTGRPMPIPASLRSTIATLVVA